MNNAFSIATRTFWSWQLQTHGCPNYNVTFALSRRLFSSLRCGSLPSHPDLTRSPTPFSIQPFGPSTILKSFVRAFHPAPSLAKKTKRQPRKSGNGQPSRDIPSERPTSSPAAFDALSTADLDSCFRRQVPQQDAKQVLQTLHSRRVDGSLVDVGITVPGSAIPRDAVVHALDWLRARYPVDEQEAAAAYASRESQKLSKEYIGRAIKYRLLKPDTLENVVQDNDVQFGTEESALEGLQKYHQRRERQAEKRRQKQEKSPAFQKSKALELQKAETQREERESKDNQAWLWKTLTNRQAPLH